MAVWLSFKLFENYAVEGLARELRDREVLEVEIVKLRLTTSKKRGIVRSCTVNFKVQGFRVQFCFSVYLLEAGELREEHRDHLIGRRLRAVLDEQDLVRRRLLVRR